MVNKTKNNLLREDSGRIGLSFIGQVRIGNQSNVTFSPQFQAGYVIENDTGMMSKEVYFQTGSSATGAARMGSARIGAVTIYPYSTFGQGDYNVTPIISKGLQSKYKIINRVSNKIACNSYEVENTVKKGVQNSYNILGVHDASAVWKQLKPSYNIKSLDTFKPVYQCPYNILETTSSPQTMNDYNIFSPISAPMCINEYNIMQSVMNCSVINDYNIFPSIRKFVTPNGYEIFNGQLISLNTNPSGLAVTGWF